MNPADRFMEAFPHATEANGWSTKHLLDMVKDASKLGLSGEEFQKVVDALLRKQRRSLVPSYADVYAAMDASVRERAAARVDSTVERMRNMTAEYEPPSEQEKAWRRACTAALRDGKPSMSFAQWRATNAN